jgi:hypothetical protein
MSQVLKCRLGRPGILADEMHIQMYLRHTVVVVVVTLTDVLVGVTVVEASTEVVVVIYTTETDVETIVGTVETVTVVTGVGKERQLHAVDSNAHSKGQPAQLPEPKLDVSGLRCC